MSTHPTQNILSILTVACIFAVPASAVPIQGLFVDDPTHCDSHADYNLTHELGDAAVFPAEESIFYDAKNMNVFVCVPDDGIANDYEIRMQNLSGVAWQDVTFVVDEGVNFSQGNYDGSVVDLSSATGANTLAFRIDSVGGNAPLVFESMTADDIWEIGEFWTIHVTNFGNGSQTPVFDSVGVFGVGSGGFPPSTASILANVVPEPASLGLLAAGAALLIGRRRRRT